MDAELLVYHKGKKVFRVPVNKEEFRIGKYRRNDLILQGSSIAAEHALIRRTHKQYVIKSLGDFPLYLNEKEGVSFDLSHRDKIIFEDWKIEFCLPQLLATSEVSGSTKHLPGFVKEGCGDVKPHLLIQDSQNKASFHRMTKRDLFIGSARSCDIVLRDEYVSKKHLYVARRERSVYVKDLNSTNGTYVDGVKIQEASFYKECEIKIGHTKIKIQFVAKNGSEKPLSEGSSLPQVVFLGESFVAQKIKNHVAKIAKQNVPVLIQGESGSGKEVVAQLIHDNSERKHKPFVVINCGALSSQLIESELFGHEKGAFTGAEQKRIGVFEQAHEGTLFLDEIAELPLEQQAKLLRVLECQKVRRVGAQNEVEVNVRVVSATHKNLFDLVRRGLFREDLFFRLCVFPVELPALRDRKEDLKLLVPFLLKKQKVQHCELTQEAWQKLYDYQWPGNVRELKNVLLRALALKTAECIQACDIQFYSIQSFEKEEVASLALPLPKKKQKEKDLILWALKESLGDKSKAAKLLGMGRSTIFRKIKEYKI